MSMEPNIDIKGFEDSFSHVDNVQNLKHETTFNYYTWAPNSVITLLTVPWDNEYSDVVYFESQEDKEKWFKAQAVYSEKITKVVRIPKSGIVKVTIKNNDILKYNYLVAEYCSPYDASKAAKYYYFINDIEYMNNSVWELNLSLDYWMTYSNDITVNNGIIERGHAPMYLMTPEQFLKAPSSNCGSLIEPDIQPPQNLSVSHTSYVPVQPDNGNGRWAIVATTCMPTDDYTSDMAPIWSTYDHLGNPDEEGGMGNYIKPDPYRVGDIGEGNVYYFAVAAHDVGGLFTKIRSDYPAFMQTVKGIFYVSDVYFNMLNENYAHYSFDFGGYTCYGVQLKDEVKLATFELTKDKFGISNQYGWITKLYTYPYSSLEVTDSNGGTIEIEIQDIAREIDVYGKACLILPVLNIRAMLTGIGGSTDGQYFDSFDNDTYKTQVKVYKDDSHKMFWDFGIPVFSVYQAKREEFNIQNHFALEQERNAIKVAETKATWAKENASMNANKQNYAAYQNACSSNDTAKKNADASADTASGIAKRNNDQVRDFTQDDIDLSETVQDKNIETSKRVSDYHLTIADRAMHMNANNQLMNVLVGTAGNVTNAVLNAGSAIAGTTPTAAGMAQTSFNLVSLAFNAGMTEQKQEESWKLYRELTKLSLNELAMTAKINGSFAKTFSVTTSDVAGLFFPELDGINASVSVPEQDGHVNAAARYILEKTNDVKEDHKTKAHTNAESDRTDSLTLAKNNASRSKTTADGIALNSYTVGGEIITNNENLAENNKVADKRLAEEGILNKMRQANIGAPVEYGSYDPSGLKEKECAEQGITFKIKTLPWGALHRVALEFIRYGYRYNQDINHWNVQEGYYRRPESEFNWMTYYTYWKYSDVKIRSCGYGVPMDGINKIKNILLNGVTVYRKPEYIYQVDITSNRMLDKYLITEDNIND